MTQQLHNMAEAITALGEVKIGTTTVDHIVFDRGFRALCESNACGCYNKNYTCPPHCGDIDSMIAHVKTYRDVLVYQTVYPLEDSYDYEGMMEAGKLHGKLADKVTTLMQKEPGRDVLHLGAGGCRLCDKCGIQDHIPCRHPDRVLVSLEANGIDVSQLAASCGMRYINGQNTVTYFGALFCPGDDHAGS